MEPGNFLLRFPTKTPKQLTGPGKSGPEFSPLPSQLRNVHLAQATLKERVKAGSNAEFSSNSKILDKGLAKLFGYPPRKSSRETDFALSSNKRDEHLAKLFDEILLQVFSKVPLEETRAAAGRSITRRDTKERATVDGNSHEPELFFDSTDRMSNNEDVPTDDQNHNPPHVENISQTLQRLSDHIAGEQRDQESSLFNRDVSDTQLTTIDKGTHQEAVSPDVPSRGMPCSQLLQFLQKNIIVAAVSVVGIAVAAVLLLLALLVSVRKRQLLHSPADMTYNIFIMNGKTWWQKSQDKKTKKHAGKQKQLKLNSGI
ncbi:uncharacterized protein C2orf92 homolog isoform X2 [Cervus canadensis]|uniref:uncharacterized protein C2orf92 homolog isoform X2 n=1 Tax=Cervus canadensis TaxID=1574408 RepID=UPI001C9E350E|nr:uncharacterized protein C2orf92 homolog isoform X2 [Cervus canadensis]